MEPVDAREREFVNLLQAQAADIVSADEVRHRVETLFPEWFTD